MEAWVKFKSRPPAMILDTLKENGFRWERARLAWYSSVGNELASESTELGRDIVLLGGEVVTSAPAVIPPRPRALAIIAECKAAVAVAAEVCLNTLSESSDPIPTDQGQFVMVGVGGNTWFGKNLRREDPDQSQWRKDYEGGYVVYVSEGPHAELPARVAGAKAALDVLEGYGLKAHVRHGRQD